MINLAKKNWKLAKGAYYYFSDQKVEIPSDMVDLSFDIIQFRTETSTKIYASNDFFDNEFTIYSFYVIKQFIEYLKITPGMIQETELKHFIRKNLYFTHKFLPIPISTFLTAPDYIFEESFCFLLDANTITPGDNLINKYKETIQLLNENGVEAQGVFIVEDDNKFPTSSCYSYLSVDKVPYIHEYLQDKIIIVSRNIEYDILNEYANLRFIKYIDYSIKSLIGSEELDDEGIEFISSKYPAIGLLTSFANEITITQRMIQKPVSSIDSNKNNDQFEQWKQAIQHIIDNNG